VSRPLVALLAATALLGAGCQDGSEPRAEEVGPVSLEVPGGWDRTDQDGPDLVAQSRWASTGQQVTTLQVVVGCGDETAETLALGAVSQPRDELSPTGAEDPQDVEVPGLDDALTTTLTYGGDRPDDQQTLRMAGLYGAGHGGLVLVEVAAPTTAWSDGRAEQVLGSVTVDADALADACDAPA
jgi:hypothetical protein